MEIVQQSHLYVASVEEHILARGILNCMMMTSHIVIRFCINVKPEGCIQEVSTLSE